MLTTHDLLTALESQQFISRGKYHGELHEETTDVSFQGKDRGERYTLYHCY